MISLSSREQDFRCQKLITPAMQTKQCKSRGCKDLITYLLSSMQKQLLRNQWSSKSRLFFYANSNSLFLTSTFSIHFAAGPQISKTVWTRNSIRDWSVLECFGDCVGYLNVICLIRGKRDTDLANLRGWRPQSQTSINHVLRDVTTDIALMLQSVQRFPFV